MTTRWSINSPIGDVQRGQVSEAASLVAFMCAIDSIEIIGLTPDAVGKHEPSATSRLRTSHVIPSGLVADVRGGLRRLAVERNLVLDDTGDIVMAHPFASVPLGFSVMGPSTLR